MGFYIEPDGPKNKAEFLFKQHGAELLLTPKFPDNSDTVLICVVDNNIFEAAGICFNEQEFRAFNDPRDYRKKVWLTLPKATVIKLCPPVARKLK